MKTLRRRGCSRPNRRTREGKDRVQKNNGLTPRVRKTRETAEDLNRRPDRNRKTKYEEVLGSGRDKKQRKGRAKRKSLGSKRLIKG